MYFLDRDPDRDQISSCIFSCIQLGLGTAFQKKSSESAEVLGVGLQVVDQAASDITLRCPSGLLMVRIEGQDKHLTMLY